MTKLNLAAIVAALLLCGISNANAGMVTHSFTYGSANLGNDTSFGGTFFNITVPTFDESLGTLDSVSYDIAGTVRFTGVFDGAGSFGGGGGGTVSVNGMGFTGGGVNGNAPDGTPGEAATFDAALSIVSNATMGNQLFETANGPLADYDLSYVFSGSATNGSADLLGGTVDITYNFTAVPEPGSFTLFLGVMGFMVRRKRQTNAAQ